MGGQSPAKKARTGSFTTVDNFIGTAFVAPQEAQYLDVQSPCDGSVIGKVALSGAKDVDAAVKVAQKAFKVWGKTGVKKRVKCLIKLHELIEEHEDEIADLIVLEHGKNKPEALGDVRKGNETVEYAMGMPSLIPGGCLEVAGGVECREVREALGVVACVVPFNFPAMVPFWTTPIAIATGNCVILKPSEKVPLTMHYIAGLFKKAGVPEGVFQIVNGAKPVVEALCDHPDIAALTFVGSSKVAEIVSKRCRALSPPKKCVALGGAKNHLVAVPDCNTDMASTDIVNSFAGCTGQRCMAASVLLTVTHQPKLLDAVVAKAKALVPGSGPRQIGPVIDADAQKRIINYIDAAEKNGAKILVDGRDWAKKHTHGFWVGPTVMLFTDGNDPAMKEEIFGPTLSIMSVPTRDAAIDYENASPFGNAAAIYTTSGSHAEWFQRRFSASMIGVNIGVPVPREPFSFGGINASKFGDCDITGDACIEFFTWRRKITTKWNPPETQDWMS